jgi:hypothetical protein
MNRIVGAAVFLLTLDVMRHGAEAGVDAGHSSNSQIHQTQSERKPANVAAGSALSLPKSVQAGYVPTQVSVQLDPVDAVKLQEEDKQRVIDQKPLRIGVVRSVPGRIHPHRQGSAGHWKSFPGAGESWLLLLESTGAIGIRVHFHNVKLADGCQIFVYDRANPAKFRGPYDERTLRGRKEFWTGSVFSDRIVVECHVPQGAAKQHVQFDIGEIVHVYKDPTQLITPKEGSCHNDVTCDSSWDAEADGVAGIGTIGGSDAIWCTGCLLTDTDATTFIDNFMTANHCVGNQSEADTTEYYWFFQTSTCNGTPPSLASVPSTDGGADYLAGQTRAAGNDFAFLRLRQTTPGGVTYVGWTTGTPGAGEALTGIHHPDGAYKRISYGGLDGSNADYWDIQWSNGVTEPGSSGSPVFNANNQFIGQLWGGASSCSIPAGVDEYGRFNVSFQEIEQWLDAQEDAYEPNNSFAQAYPFGEQTFLSTISGSGIQCDDDWYEVTVNNDRIVVDCTFTDADGDIDISLHDAAGTLMASSTSVTDDEHIDFAACPELGGPGFGTYYIRVYFGNDCNSYDLWWDDVSEAGCTGGGCATDDAYEENDTQGAAHAFGEQTLLSTISGFGVQCDDDWYEITADNDRIVVDCTFSDAAGDIDISLHDAAGTVLDSSSSITDDEHIEFVVCPEQGGPGFGTYYIRVHFGDAGNDYDLWWDDVPDVNCGSCVPDDAYEENDTLGTAVAFGEQTFLSSISGTGLQCNDDWYEITVNNDRIVVDCTFTDADGDIDISLHDAAGTLMALSTSVSDDEHLEFSVCPELGGPGFGTYYIRVYFGDAGNSYDLWWDDVSDSNCCGPDDVYEENDTLGTALPFNEQTFLSSLSGLGVQCDDDWYEITVNNDRIVVDCTFTDADGDIDISLHDAGGALLASSPSITDDEHVEFCAPYFGTYYVRVYFADNGNTYDLWWDDAISLSCISVPRLGQISIQSGSDIRLEWPSVPGRRYAVQHKNSVLDPAWAVIPGSEQTATQSTSMYLDGNVLGPTRVYRIVDTTPPEP